MRLIDAERLKRTFRASVPPVAQDFVEGFCVIVDNVSTVDAVEVVRCKDCYHYSIVNEPYDESWCSVMEDSVPTDGYCYHGRRREVTV